LHTKPFQLRMIPLDCIPKGKNPNNK